MNVQSKSNSSPIVTPSKKPDETSGFHFSSTIKIIDPNTNEVLLQKRAD